MTRQTDIAIVGFAQTPAVSRADEAEVQLCLSVISEALESAKLTRKEIDFTCSHATAGPCLQQNLICVLQRAEATVPGTGTTARSGK
jgi:hypothetical protein